MTKTCGLIAASIVLVFFVIINLRILLKRIFSGDYSFSDLFLFFRQKIWMTAGIAIFFGSLYLLFNLIGSKFFGSNMLLASFHYALEHPTSMVIWGCIVFVLNAILIVLVRRVLRFIYTMRD